MEQHSCESCLHGQLVVRICACALKPPQTPPTAAAVTLSKQRLGPCLREPPINTLYIHCWLPTHYEDTGKYCESTRPSTSTVWDTHPPPLRCVHVQQLPKASSQCLHAPPPHTHLDRNSVTVKIPDSLQRKGSSSEKCRSKQDTLCKNIHLGSCL